ncbi:MAG: flagellar motor switch protein FliM [Deltaproteobacteria bacterium]|nr:flagellar motor switch protein FliM [Deltaproteobacteria bacterium]MBW1976389.1 flagellar motor switch protein FliM [Deltaproteobacteria bacterium]MBW2043333.1 flagellar motor switch protein FliM [Deltaproteobacteria bacterium]MBW2299375.1 flagellar motor switch protein FliM [Deltaproteobacteria bacterium]
MANVLSQEEVDSLLDGITKGEVETETNIPKSDEGIDLYDFTSAGGPTHQKMPALGMINERFVGFLKRSLSTFTGSVVGVSIDSFQSIEFGKFHRSIPVPASLNIFKIEPFRGFALLVLEGRLAFAFVETLFGGRGVSQIKLEGKGFTSVEAKIIGRIVKIILDDFQRAWADVHKVTMTFSRSEIDPQFAEITTPSDTVIVTKLKVDLENFAGTMMMCIPYSTIEPIRDELKNSFHGEKSEQDSAWKDYLEKKLREVTINMSCILGTATITGKELMSLKVGDILQLEQTITDPATLFVEGVPKFKAHPGTYNKRKAIRIEGMINEE